MGEGGEEGEVEEVGAGVRAAEKGDGQEDEVKWSEVICMLFDI